MMGHVIDALAMIGAVVLAWFLLREVARNRSPSRDNPPLPPSNDVLRQATVEQSRRRDNAIQGALDGSDPAGRLADLGNEDRE